MGQRVRFAWPRERNWAKAKKNRQKPWKRWLWVFFMPRDDKRGKGHARCEGEMGFHFYATTESWWSAEVEDGQIRHLEVKDNPLKDTWYLQQGKFDSLVAMHSSLLRIPPRDCNKEADLAALSVRC